jgi:phospholipid/cholesterol/gamma-HCH transport system substrate-binding protein
MIGRGALRSLLVIWCCVLVTVTGCAFQGMNSLPLPGTAGREPGAQVFHVQIANVGTMESNSPVMIDDVVIGSVGTMRVRGWHADVEVSIRPGVVVPGNAFATIGQTSLLGSSHLALDPPLGQPPVGRLESGASIPLNRSSTYPSTEATLASLSAVVNAGGLGQLGDIIHNLNAALSGREGQIRELLGRLDSFVGVLNSQQDNVIASIHALDRLAAKLSGQRDVIASALTRVPQALDVLIAERPHLTDALDRLRVFSDTATALVDDTKGDFVANLKNLEPTLRALADVGPDLDTALAFATTFPYPQNLVDRAVRGDYMNYFLVMDLTVNRLKRGLLLGTRWGQPGLPLVPAPGDPGYDAFYSNDPLGAGIAPPPPAPEPTLDPTPNGGG